MARTITIYVDKQEKRPIQFPEWIKRGGELIRVSTEARHLKTGDYQLKNRGFVKALIERKGRPQELYDCTFGCRRKQFINQLERLSKSDFPVLLLDTAPHEVEAHDFSQYNKLADPHAGEAVVERLLDLCVEYGVHLIWFGRVDGPSKEYSYGRLVVYILTTKIPQAA